MGMKLTAGGTVAAADLVMLDASGDVVVTTLVTSDAIGVARAASTATNDIDVDSIDIVTVNCEAGVVIGDHLAPSGSTNGRVVTVPEGTDGTIGLAQTAEVSNQCEMIFQVDHHLADPVVTSVLTLTEQATTPSTPASGFGSIYISDDTIPTTALIADSGSVFKMLRYIPRASQQLVCSTGGRWTGGLTAVALDQAGAVSGQIVTYDGDTADEKGVLDSVDSGAIGQAWIRNVTQSNHDVRVDAASWDTTAKTFVVDTDYNITAWSNNDVLDMDIQLGAFGASGAGFTVAFFSLQEDIVALGLGQAHAALMELTIEDNGVVGAGATPPWARLMNGVTGGPTNTVYGQIQLRNTVTTTILPLYNGTGYEGSFGVQIDSTGSSTQRVLVSVYGYFA